MSESKNVSLENWSNFFKEIAPIFEKRKIILDEKKKRGDFFNVFSILNVERKEIRHSAFLSALFNPNGEHGLGNLFLSDFIKNIVQKQKLKFEWDCNDVYVNTEEPTEEKNGRMDIYMESKGKIIIIENKIDAKDGENQLICYDNHARTKGNNHCLLYLTLNGQCASEISTDSKGIKLEAKKDYFPISYKDDILPWLERCLEIAALYPKVRETIAQYIDLIKKLTNMGNMDENILNLILANGNIDITAYLLDNENTIKSTIFKKTINEITNNLENETSIKWEHGCESNEKYLFRPKGWQYFWFTIWLPINKGCFFSIYCEEKYQDTISQSKPNITLGKLKNNGNKKKYPFGEVYLKDSDNYKNLINSEFMSHVITNIKDIMEDIIMKNEEMKVEVQLSNQKIPLANCFNIIDK